MKAIYLLLLWIPLFTSAQIKMDYVESIFTREGTQLINAAAGGLNSPQFSEVDLNNDGILDLVVYDRAFYGSIKTFLKKDDAFVFAPIYQQAFPTIRNWMLMRDYNGDGFADIFTNTSVNGIKVYLNLTGTNGFLSFAPITSNLFTVEAEFIYVVATDIPAIADLDEDGDLDILSFNQIGNRVVFFRNLSIEQTGKPEELIFENASNCWGFFAEDDNNNELSLFDTCNTFSDPSRNERHAGSTLLTLDVTGNGLKELILGDISFKGLLQLNNTGTMAEASITEVIEAFPANTTPVDLTVFPAAYEVDVDNNQLPDLLVSPNNPNTSINTENVWYYKNIGTADIPAFEFQQNDFLVESMIDLGERSHAIWFDENLDGKPDLLIGSYGVFEGAGVFSSRLSLYRNTSPNDTVYTFEWVSDDYAGLSQYDFNGVYPALADMDNDQDLDLLIGTENNLLHYFENVAENGQAADFQLDQFDYFGLRSGKALRPFLIDLNRDGLVDLLVGERNGTIIYYQNQGSAQAAFFADPPTHSPLGAININPTGEGYSSPFVNQDDQGNYQLFVGSEQGYIYRYTNIEGNLQGSFQLTDSIYLHATQVSYAASEPVGDSRMIVSSEFTGGIQLWREGERPLLNIPENQNKKSAQITLYPNPCNYEFYLQHEGGLMIGQLILYDLLANRVWNAFLPPAQAHIKVKLPETLQPGLYILQIQLPNGSVVSEKLILQRKFSF